MTALSAAPEPRQPRVYTERQIVASYRDHRTPPPTPGRPPPEAGFPSPPRPSDPRHSAEGRLLGVFLDAVSAADSVGQLSLLMALMAGEEIEFGILPDADRQVVGRIRSALLEEADRAAGRLPDVEHWLWRAGIELSPEGRELLRLPAAQALDELVGREEADGWHPGRACLTPWEQDAFRRSLEVRVDYDPISGRWSCRALASWEVTQEMRRRRGDTEKHLAVETVERYLRDARRKVSEYLLGEGS